MTQICCRCQKSTRNPVELDRESANAGGLPLYDCPACRKKPKRVPFVRRCSG